MASPGKKRGYFTRGHLHAGSKNLDLIAIKIVTASCSPRHESLAMTVIVNVLIYPFVYSLIYQVNQPLKPARVRL